MKSVKKIDIDKVLGEIFKEYRVKNKLTQEKIAEKLGISVKYISRIENGTGGVKVETLVNYMNILGIFNVKARCRTRCFGGNTESEKTC